MRKLPWLCGCLLVLACSSSSIENGDASGVAGHGGGGHAGGTTGSSGQTGSGGGQAGRGGTTGAGGQTGGTTGAGGQTGGTTGAGGTSGASGQTGTGGGQAGRGGTTGGGGRGGSTGGGGQAGTGTAGQGGSGGRGGSGGDTGGVGGSGDCAQFEADYLAALAQAKMCNAAGTGQCQLLASTSLSCPGCMTHVNDTFVLNDIKTRYQRANCPAVICPLAACVNPGTGACVPINSGDFCQ